MALLPFVAGLESESQEQLGLTEQIAMLLEDSTEDISGRGYIPSAGSNKWQKMSPAPKAAGKSVERTSPLAKPAAKAVVKSSSLEKEKNLAIPDVVGTAPLEVKFSEHSNMPVLAPSLFKSKNLCDSMKESYNVEPGLNSGTLGKNGQLAMWNKLHCTKYFQSRNGMWGADNLLERDSGNMCASLKSKYNIKPKVHWGSLRDTKLKGMWTSLGCNDAIFH